MDIHLVINHLGLNSNSYSLSQSNPPHEIVRWAGPDPQPTQAILNSAWVEIQADEDYQVHIADKSKPYPVGG